MDWIKLNKEKVSLNNPAHKQLIIDTNNVSKSGSAAAAASTEAKVDFSEGALKTLTPELKLALDGERMVNGLRS